MTPRMAAIFGGEPRDARDTIVAAVVVEVATAKPVPAVDAYVDAYIVKPSPIIAKAVCRCGSTTWRGVSIHDGQSVRRDCGRCGRFINFSVWYGKQKSTEINVVDNNINKP